MKALGHPAPDHLAEPLEVKRDLSALFDPRSVAVVGASGIPGKWGFWLARGAIKGEDRRSVFLVNRKGGEILGRDAYASVKELPEAPELVVITVPAVGVEEAVHDSLGAGAKGIVLISAGLGEMGEEGAARERAIVERVRAAGAVLIGPNCLGVHDSGAQLELCSEELESGSLGLISQSGNLALEIGMVGAEFGLGFSRFVSLGNAADVQAAELIESFAEHEPTQLIAVYLEDFRDGRGSPARARRPSRRGRRWCSSPASDRGERAGREVAHGRSAERPGLDPGGLSGCRHRAGRLAEGGRRRRDGPALAPSTEGAADRSRGGRRRAHGRRV